MRDIVFKGKLKSGDRWVTGVPVKYLNGQYYMHTVKSKWVVEPETICQYTNINDVNNQPIFEGDIIKVLDCFDNEVIYLIDYKDAAFCANQKDANFSVYLSEFNTGRYSIEIIGNRFDNPELFN